MPCYTQVYHFVQCYTEELNNTVEKLYSLVNTNFNKSFVDLQCRVSHLKRFRKLTLREFSQKLRDLKTLHGSEKVLENLIKTRRHKILKSANFTSFGFKLCAQKLSNPNMEIVWFSQKLNSYCNCFFRLSQNVFSRFSKNNFLDIFFKF